MIINYQFHIIHSSLILPFGLLEKTISLIYRR